MVKRKQKPLLEPAVTQPRVRKPKGAKRPHRKDLAPPPPLTKPTVENEATLLRRHAVMRLILIGKSYYEVAKELRIDMVQVIRDVKRLRRFWIKETLKAYAEHKGRELAYIHRLQTEAWEAWFKSNQDAETIKRVEEQRLPRASKKNPDPQDLMPIKQLLETVKKGQSGNAAYLSQIAWCIEMRCRLLGLLTPETTLENDVHGQSITAEQWEQLMRPTTRRVDPLQYAIAQLPPGEVIDVTPAR